jgi:hypothetical protein
MIGFRPYTEYNTNGKSATRALALSAMQNPELPAFVMEMV